MTEKPELFKKRIFISDWELRQTPGDIPENAIISPLSLDWLEYGDQGTSHKPEGPPTPKPPAKYSAKKAWP